MPASATARPQEDAALVRQVQDGAMDVFSDLVRRYQDRVHNTCWRICGHLEDARDLTQETFVKAFQAIGSFDGRSSFYTWLFRIAVNLALSHRRRERRRPTWSLDAMSDDPAIGTQAQALSSRLCLHRSEDPADTAATRELAGHAATALGKLNVDHRTIIVLRDIEGFCYDEIAAILELPRGTIKSRLHRARMALRDALRPYLTEDD